MAQLAEQLICNQQVEGSSPPIGLTTCSCCDRIFFVVCNNAWQQCFLVYPLGYNMDGFPSGQRGQTVNLLHIASVVRIHLHPFKI